VPNASYDVFLSYHRGPSLELARALRDALVADGLAVFLDEAEIEDFTSISHRLTEGLARSRALVALYGATYPARRACQFELTAAFLAAQRGGDPRDRVLVVNPEPGVAHIEPAELRDALFVRAPEPNDRAAVAELAGRIAHHVADLDGPLGDIRPLVPPAWYGLRSTGSSRFVGRLSSLWAIHSALHASERRPLTGTAGPGLAQLVGLAGIGKTLLAEEYALRFGPAYPGGVFWLRASAAPSEAQRDAERGRALRIIAVELGVPLEVLTTPDEVEAALGRRIEERGQPCLWVIDDLPGGLGADEFRRWLARPPIAATLVTTQSRGYDAFGKLVDPGLLAPVEALELLAAHRRPAGRAEAAAAELLAHDLGHNALALDVAGAAVAHEAGATPYAAFRAALADPTADELEAAAGLADVLPTGHEPSIATTILRAIARLGPEGTDMLRMAAVLAPAQIPASFVDRVLARADGLEEGAARTAGRQARQQVETASLAERVGEDPLAHTVHGLVTRTMRLRDDRPDRRAQLRTAASGVLLEELPAAADVRQQRLEPLVAHAEHLLRDPQSVDEAALLGWLGRLDRERGAYASAVTLYERQRELLKRLVGPDHPDTLTAMINLAVTLVEDGRSGEARRVLENLLSPGVEFPDPRVAILYHRTLARAYRGDLDFDLAREQVSAAMVIAEYLRDAQTVSALLETRAIIEKMDGRLGDASLLYERATDIDRSLGNLGGAGQLANGHAMVFLDNGLEGAEDLLLQAIALAQDDRDRGIALDNLSLELDRQQRHEESAERGRQAAEVFRRLDNPRHLYISLVRRVRQLVSVGRLDEAGACFVEAHDMIHAQRRNAVNTPHYEQYGERVKAIEAATAERMNGLEIGIHAMLGDGAYQEAMQALEQNRLEDARTAFDTAEAEFEALGAEHLLIGVAAHRAQLLRKLGEDEAALRLANVVRARARSIGDAQREGIAISVQMLLDHLIPDGDALDLLAQARALVPVTVRQVHGDAFVDAALKNGVTESDLAHLIDGGVMDMAAGRLAHKGAARQLADSYFESALRAARQFTELPHRLAMRLAGLIQMRTEIGDVDGAATYAAELEKLAQDLGDTQIDMITAQMLGDVRYARGDWSADTLRLLERACATYEATRRASRQPEGLEGLADFFNPPYAAAAEVSLSLNQAGRARKLLERGKAQALREAVANRDGPRPVASTPARAVPGGETLHYLVGTKGCYVIRKRSRSSASRLIDLGDADSASWTAYIGALDRFVAASDDRRGLDIDPVAALAAVLDHPIHDTLTRPVQEAVRSGRAVLVPHRVLHHAPLHLRKDGGVTQSLPVTFLPSEALATSPRAGSRRGLVAAAGDSLGDLPFARAESIFASDADLRAIGKGLDADWIERVVRRHDVGLIHLACHGRFDGRHPDQSGLVLAASHLGRAGNVQTGRLLSLRDLAALPLQGQIVILSACSTGRQVLRTADETSGLGTALLAAGASSVIVALWPVPDLATLLLMRGVHASIRAQPDTVDLPIALAVGRAAVTGTTARDLVDLSQEFAEASSTHDRSSVEAALRARQTAEAAVGNEAQASRLSRTVERLREGRVSSRKALARLPKHPERTDDRYEATPFTDAFYWGAFVVWGAPEASI
jgi:CHAT domain-containing protein/tetratricopeptide (TPR) repeat protein